MGAALLKGEHDGGGIIERRATSGGDLMTLLSPGLSSISSIGSASGACANASLLFQSFGLWRANGNLNLGFGS
jgi:hypothetical protein